MLNRRSALMSLSGALVAPKTVLAATPREITWDDLLPAGVPYSEIIGEGELDEVNDTWNPIYDENATKLNESLDGSYIKMPGFIIPFPVLNPSFTHENSFIAAFQSSHPCIVSGNISFGRMSF